MPGISRKLVKDVFLDFAECVMPQLIKEQQVRHRQGSGRSQAVDNTYATAASLTAEEGGKVARYRASVTTVTGEGGYVHAMYLAPDDSQAVPQAILCGLHGAELPSHLAETPGAEYLELINKDVSSNGCMGHFPQVIATDKSHSDKNLWARIGSAIIDGWQRRGQAMLSPPGILA
jgi:hypothetical protein